MTRVKFAAIVTAVVFVAGAAVTMAAPAWAWHAPTVTGDVECRNGVQVATVTASNDENETATVRSSTGPVFLIGTHIPAHAHVPQSFTKPNSFTGSITVTFAVDFPSDGTDRSSSVTLHFKGGCAVPPVVTTSPPDDTTPPVPPGRTPDAPVKAATPTATAGPAPIVVTSVKVTG